MFVNEIVSRPVLMFANDTKIFWVFRNRDDYIALRNDLELLQRWSQLWHLKFNASKCKHLHFCGAHHYGDYYLNRTLIDITETLVLFLMTSLNFTFTRLMLPKKLIEFLDWLKDLYSTMLTLLFNTLVRASWKILYAWGPHYFLDKKKIEKVQRRGSYSSPSSISW